MLLNLIHTSPHTHSCIDVGSEQIRSLLLLVSNRLILLLDSLLLVLELLVLRLEFLLGP
jgi:hypothetical protein